MANSQQRLMVDKQNITDSYKVGAQTRGNFEVGIL